MNTRTPSCMPPTSCCTELLAEVEFPVDKENEFGERISRELMELERRFDAFCTPNSLVNALGR